MLAVIRSLADEGRTMLLVTHELGFAYHVATRVLFDGVIHRLVRGELPAYGEVRIVLVRHQARGSFHVVREHLPKVFGERKNEISMAWAVGYCRAALAGRA